MMLLSVYALCATAAMRRLSIDATGARYAVVCAWGVLCNVRVLPQILEHDDYQVLLRQKRQHTEHPRQHAAVVDNAHRATVSSMLHLHPATPPPHDLAGLRRSLALVWPRHTGHAFGER